MGRKKVELVRRRETLIDTIPIKGIRMQLPEFVDQRVSMTRLAHTTVAHESLARERLNLTDELRGRVEELFE